MKYPSSLPFAFIFAATFGLLLPAFIRGQGALTPPGGPPTPTMKTLDQVEPRIPINATNTPGNAGNVFRITAPGSYYLTAPLAAVANKNGILIDTSYVTIDLCGFPLAGTASSRDAIVVGTDQHHIAVRNGIIKDWGEDGIDAVEATDSTYEHLLVAHNTADGLRVGPDASVAFCKLSFNGGHGASVNGDATISHSTAAHNGLSGFFQASGSVTHCVSTFNGESGFKSKAAEFSHCVANGNVGNGFEDTYNPALAGGPIGPSFSVLEDAAGSYFSCAASRNDGRGFLINARPMTVNSCTADHNQLTGIDVGEGANVTGCTVTSNSNFGIESGFGSTVARCTIRYNWFSGIFAGGYSRLVENMCDANGDGLRVYGDRNRIEGNHLSGNGGTGLLVASVQNLIIKNTASDNGTNYQIAADNHYGPIVNLTALGTAAVLGNTAPDTTATVHPLANFAQ